jgi:hypothetical protein
MNFKEWLITERQTSFLMQTAERVVFGLKKLYSSDVFNEDNVISKVPQELMDGNSCGTLCNWIRKFNSKFIPGSHNKTKCGMEGCVLFLGNKYVVKFTKGVDEANIAYLMKGDASFPVVDVITYQGMYLIAMKELNTDFKKIDIEIHDATYLVYQFISDLEDENKDKTKVPTKFNIKEFNYWMAGRPEDPMVLDFANQIIKLMEKVFKKTGYSIGHDWSPDNLGLNNKNKLQSFDFGHSRKYGRDVKQSEIPSLD